MFISCGQVVRDFEREAKTRCKVNSDKLGGSDFTKIFKTDHVQCLGGSLDIDFSKNLVCKV